MTDNSFDDMATKVVNTGGIAWLALKSGMKPQSAAHIALYLICACIYEVNIYGMLYCWHHPDIYC